MSALQKAAAGVATIIAGAAAAAVASNATAIPAANTATTTHVTPQTDSDRWIAIDMSKYNLDHHLLHSALSGDDKLERYDLALAPDARSLRAIVRLGDQACGHPRIVHGGAIASILDDAFGVLFYAAKVGNGFTANLHVDYRKPLPAGTDVHVFTRIDRVEGRKVRRTRDLLP